MTREEKKTLRRTAQKVEKILQYTDYEMSFTEIIKDMVSNEAKETIKNLAFENNSEEMENLGLPVSLVVAVDVYWFRNIDGKEAER